ncbi:MAG: MTH1187 family thiamine-binding protein [Oleiphilaceae bacterium]|nr:MTH1187 family thiamine-binding protein [Oleiphilaceae bacterium]
MIHTVNLEDIMKVTADICVIPMGVGPSISDYIARCERILEKAGLEPEINAEGTSVEGDWDQVFNAVKECHEAMHQEEVPRVFTALKFSTRTDREQSRLDKTGSVKRKLGESS